MKNNLKPKSALILLTLFFILSGLISLYSQQPLKCLAVITEINGEALVRGNGMGGFTKARWGTQLFQGDQIATSDKSDVKLLFEDNSLIILGHNSMLTISGNAPPLTEPMGDVKKISSAAIINLSALTSRKAEKKDAGALAGLRSVSYDQSINLTSPRNTFIKTDRPFFVWETKQPFDKFTVNLYNSKGLVWSKKVIESALTYPDSEKGLVFGESYFWNVEGEYLIDTEKSANHKFTVLTHEKLKEISDNESIIRDTFKENPECSSFHSILGAYYIDQGLLQDAIGEFQVIAKINSDSALPHEILGSLYSNVGEKDKAIEELQKALMLKNKDN